MRPSPRGLRLEPTSSGHKGLLARLGDGSIGLYAVTIDGDGVPDIVIGKRHWSHLESYADADPTGPGVLYWYRTVRNPKAPGGAEFVPHIIHNRSGVGSTVTVADLNRDGLADVLTATTRGTYVFLGQPNR